jgi:hypothetical protein
MQTRLFISIIMILVAAVFSGCGAADRAFTTWTGELTYKCSQHGVEYVQSNSGIALSVNPDGSPVKCQ